MTHWTQVLSNVSLVEFVLLAVLTVLQWIRYRIAGAGWVALAFVLLGGLSLTIKIDPTLDTHQYLAKALVACCSWRRTACSASRRRSDDRVGRSAPWRPA